MKLMEIFLRERPKAFKTEGVLAGHPVRGFMGLCIFES